MPGHGDPGVVYFPPFVPKPPVDKGGESTTSKKPLWTPLGENERSGEGDNQDGQRGKEKKASRSRSRHESKKDRHDEKEAGATNQGRKEEQKEEKQRISRETLQNWLDGEDIFGFKWT